MSDEHRMGSQPPLNVPAEYLGQQVDRLLAENAKFSDINIERVAEIERLRGEVAELLAARDADGLMLTQAGRDQERLRTALSRANVGMEQAERGLYLQLEKAESEIEHLRADLLLAKKSHADTVGDLHSLRAELEGFTHEAPGVAVYRLAGDKLERENVSELLAEFERLRTENAELREGFKTIREIIKEVRAEECCCEPGYQTGCTICAIDGVLTEQAERDESKPGAGT